MTLPLLALALLLVAGRPAAAQTEFVALGYHDVVDDASALTYDAVTVQSLAAQFEWLRVNGYRVISLDDVLAASRGQRPLPPRAVLLSFDDGYQSAFTRVFPLLQAFSYPAVVGIVGRWIEAGPGTVVAYGGERVPRERFATWEQLATMRRSGLVEIASHTWGLHERVIANPDGGEVPAVVVRRYSGRSDRPFTPARGAPAPPASRPMDPNALLAAPFTRYAELGARLAEAAMEYGFDPVKGRYETDAEYLQRVRDDLARNSRIIEQKVGVRPRTIAWPYGRFNDTALAAARAEGMTISLSLDPERADARELGWIGRYYPTQNADVRLMSEIMARRVAPSRVRGLCASLDELYAPTDEERDRKLGALIERVAAFDPSVLVLRVAASPSSGASGAMYFPSERLPMRADLFARASWSLRTKGGVEIFAWLPPAQAGPDAASALAVYEAMAKAVPFDGLSLGPRFLTGALVPGAPISIRSWDPRIPRRRRAAQDLATLAAPARQDLAAITQVSRYQPALRVLDVVPLELIRPPGELALDAIEHLAVQWDGDPKTALQKLAKQGWLSSPWRERLAYMSARAEPEVWRAVHAAGLVNVVYCPERLPEDPATLAALRPLLSSASYPFPRR